MNAVRLTTRWVEKPWGRRDLLPAFGKVPAKQEPVGEIWFENPRGGEPELLVKYLFTSDKLSVQVHPDDEIARQQGYRRGKEEAWLVLEAEPGAVIGLGLREVVDKETLRAAARDGTIEAMLDWRPVRAGDCFYSPAGTIHAIGAGLKLVEVQQNTDLTWRLYDYGRPRELHVDAAVEASKPVPYIRPFQPYEIEPGRRILSEGGKFVLERWTGARAGALVPEPRRPLWLIPLSGSASLGAELLEPGSVWLVEDKVGLACGEDADLLVAYPDARPYDFLNPEN